MEVRKPFRLASVDDRKHWKEEFFVFPGVKLPDFSLATKGGHGIVRNDFLLLMLSESARSTCVKTTQSTDNKTVTFKSIEAYL